jgi:hypothetical protein
MYEIQHYLTADDERDLYVDWLEKLKDTNRQDFCGAARDSHRTG